MSGEATETATDGGEGASGGVETAAATAAATSAAGRTFIVDEATFEEQFLRCQICREKFNNDDRPPKSLPCNHTFCLPCLKQVFDHSQPATRRDLLWRDEGLDGALKCPQCRVEIYLGRGEIKRLPNDHRVIQMMDFLSQAVTKCQNVCSKHERQPLNFFCKKCFLPVCRDCTVLDHKEQQGHVIVDVTDAVSESSDEFDEMENKTKDILDKMKSRWDALANASKRLDIQERQLKVSIKDTFIEYRLLLERRQEALIKMLKSQIQNNKKSINSRFVEVNECGTELQKLYDSFIQARANHDLRQLFTINQKIKEKEGEFLNASRVSDDDLFVSCSFDVPNEGQFLSEMSGLGDVCDKADISLKEPVPAQQLVLFDMEEQQERQRYRDRQNSSYDCDDIVLQHEGDPDSFDQNYLRDLTTRLMLARTRELLAMEAESDGSEESPETDSISQGSILPDRRPTERRDLHEASTSLLELPVPRESHTRRSSSRGRERDRDGGNDGTRVNRIRNQNYRVVRHPSGARHNQESQG